MVVLKRQGAVNDVIIEVSAEHSLMAQSSILSAASPLFHDWISTFRPTREFSSGRRQSLHEDPDVHMDVSMTDVRPMQPPSTANDFHLVLPAHDDDAKAWACLLALLNADQARARAQLHSGLRVEGDVFVTDCDTQHDKYSSLRCGSPTSALDATAHSALSPCSSSSSSSQDTYPTYPTSTALNAHLHAQDAPSSSGCHGDAADPSPPQQVEIVFGCGHTACDAALCLEEDTVGALLSSSSRLGEDTASAADTPALPVMPSAKSHAELVALSSPALQPSAASPVTPQTHNNYPLGVSQGMEVRQASSSLIQSATGQQGAPTASDQALGAMKGSCTGAVAAAVADLSWDDVLGVYQLAHKYCIQSVLGACRQRVLEAVQATRLSRAEDLWMPRPGCTGAQMLARYQARLAVSALGLSVSDPTCSTYVLRWLGVAVQYHDVEMEMAVLSVTQGFLPRDVPSLGPHTSPLAQQAMSRYWDQLGVAYTQLHLQDRRGSC